MVSTFNEMDIVIAISMVTAIILMTFMFPALGLVSEDNAAQDDIPRYNVSTDRFSFAGDIPRAPNNPSVGELIRTENRSDVDRRALWLDGDTSDGTELVLFNDGTIHDPIARVNVNNWDSGNVVTDQYTMQNVSDTAKHNNFSYEISFEFIEESDLGGSNMEIIVQYGIEEQPSDTAWYSRTPLVGQAFGAAEQLAGIVGWLGSFAWWLVTWLFQGTLNMAGFIFDIASFAIGLFVWMVKTYFLILTNAPSWSAVLIMIPALLIMFEFVKFSIIAISILPFT